MNALFLFLLKAAVINALMLGFYHFAIRPGRNFRLMRTVLLLAIILPLLLPLVPQPNIEQENTVVPIYVFSLPEGSDATVITPEENSNLLPLVQSSLYLTVTIILLLGTVLSVLSVIRKYLKTTEKATPFGKIQIDNAAWSPYSFFRWVFFSEEGLLHPAANWLLKHEFSHVKHGHSFDRLLSAMFRAFFWFSPFAHLNNRLLAEVHEFQADADAIKEYGDRTTYSNLIINFAGLQGQHRLTNPFSAHLKKRMTMINNLKPGKLSTLRLLSGIAVILTVALFSSMIRPAINAENRKLTQKESLAGMDTSQVKMEIVYDSPDEKLDSGALGSLPVIPPVFPGGDEARLSFFQKNILYPKAAREKNIQGTVFYKVIIDKYGKVTEPSIEKGIGEGCDEEVLRVVKMMPDWKPGMVNGEPAKVAMIIPVAFRLTENKDNLAKDQRYVYKPAADQPDMQNDPAKKKNSNKDEVFTVVENQPKFPGGEEARIAYMQKAISYPEQARKNKIEGTVYVTFVVEKDGVISNVKILRGIGGGCDEVALKAVQEMPPWIPGKQRGEPVRVQYNLPVKFMLGKGEKHSAYQGPEEKPADNREVFTVVEQPPVFPGGDDARVAYVVNNISYPAEAKSKGIQGTVYVTFVIEPNGSVSNVKVLRGVDAALDREAARVIQSMPAWSPGKQRGKPVRVQFNMPVKFSLSNNKSK